jgi:hypothetical protein
VPFVPAGMLDVVIASAGGAGAATMIEVVADAV